MCAVVANIKIIAIITVEARATDKDVVCVATETHGFLGKGVRVYAGGADLDAVPDNIDG